MNLAELHEFFKSSITYKDWTFYVGDKNGTMYLQVRFEAPDNFGGKIETQYCRKWQLSEWMTRTELVQTAWAAVQRAELHEAAENFKFLGADIFNTHLDVLALKVLCEEKEYEHRGEPTVIPTKLVYPPQDV